MYMIREKFGSDYVGTNGRWTPASNEARVFDSEDEAAEYAAEHVYRPFVIVEGDDE